MGKVETAWASQAANLKEKTGKSLDQWVVIAKSSGKEKHGEIVAFLKTKHSLTHGYANMVALKIKESGGGGAQDPDPVAEQYKGKESVKLLYDTVIALLKSFGKDVEIAPKKTYVSIRRNKQFAMLQPTKIRLDIGLNLKSMSPQGKLEACSNAMCTHRVKIETKEQLDTEVISYLKKAYNEA